MGQSQLVTVEEDVEQGDMVIVQARWDSRSDDEDGWSVDARIVFMGLVHVGEKWAVSIHSYVNGEDAYEHAFCSSGAMARRLVQNVIDEIEGYRNE